MVKARLIKFPWLGLFLIAAILLAAQQKICSQQPQTLSYLPHDENMDSVYQEYSNKTIWGFGPHECEAANDLFQQAKDCYRCVHDLKPTCPDCCLVNATSKWAIRCTPDEHPQYNCTLQAFNCPESICNSGANWTEQTQYWNNVCASPEVLNHCQHQGCPDNERPPRYTAEEQNCTASVDSWNCNFNNATAVPQNLGCNAVNATCQSPCPGPYYEEPVEITNATEDSCPSDVYPCYKYSPRQNFLDCINDCKNYTDGWDTCNNNKECCRRNVCLSDEGGGGFDISCNSNPNLAELGTCEQRLAIPNCNPDDTATNPKVYKDDQTCADLNVAANDCLLKVKGDCSSCFKQIDSDFSYTFVAKSREAVTLIWQLITQPKTPAYFLYTKVKVWEIAPLSGQEILVHESMVHQKSLEAAFSIFCATHIPSSAFKPGQAYIARVYYFLPYDQKTPLEVEVKSMRLITIRSRE